MKRLTGRLSCGGCGAVFNRFFTPPKAEGVCDVCGGELIHRDDDNEETIGKRLGVYNEQTAPLVGYFEKTDRLKSVNGDAEPSPLCPPAPEARLSTTALSGEETRIRSDEVKGN
ncbi:unnamed protein product, partial [Cyprideis torosa]